MSIAARPADHIRPPRWPGILAWSVAGATVLSLVPSVWLLLGVGCAVAANVFIEPYVLYGVLTRPGSLPGARLLLPSCTRPSSSRCPVPASCCC
jgi:hypothetical protein